MCTDIKNKQNLQNKILIHVFDNFLYRKKKTKKNSLFQLQNNVFLKRDK